MKPLNRIVLVLSPYGIELLKKEISSLNKNSTMYQKLTSWFLMAKCHKSMNESFCLYWDMACNSAYASEEKFIEMFVHKVKETEDNDCLHFYKLNRGTALNHLLAFVLEFDSANDYDPSILREMLFT